MTSIPPSQQDDFVESLIGGKIQSETSSAEYRIIQQVGEGAMGVALYALRSAPEGDVPVVVKLLRPWFVRQWGDTAKLIVRKEAIALGRLNERVPPTPFVVRFIDTGAFAWKDAEGPIEVPYIVLEYVHGGLEGTTLTQRIGESIRVTGHGFDAERMGQLIEALGQGLTAVHEVGVIHRDLKPDNVLCCGFGEEEIFKIADFGVARPVGVAATFGGFVVGTMGYAAPELAAMDQKAVGPWSDVFSFAGVVFHALTGQQYFDVTTPGEALVAVTDPHRPSIRDSKLLSPDVRSDDAACRAIDHALACATAVKTDVRPGRADAFATMLLPWLKTVAPRPSMRGRRRVLTLFDDVTNEVEWSWNVLHRPGVLGGIVRDVAWDSDGRCMAATTKGLMFWTGSAWSAVDHRGLPDPGAIRFVQRAGAGQWLVGGDEATFATLATEGVRDVRSFKGWDVRFEMLSGDIDDLAVLVGTGAGEPPSLCALSGRRWLKPLPLAQIAALTAMARIEDARWMVTGRGTDGQGYVAVYTPLDWEVRTVDEVRTRETGVRAEPPRTHDGKPVRAFLACAGQYDRGIGLATGTGGSVVWSRDGEISYETIEGGPDLSAAAVDAAGRGWAACAGTIYFHTLIQAASGQRARTGRWDVLWRDETWKAPIVSLYAEPGVVVAMTADGGIVEGRSVASSMGAVSSRATPRAG